MTGPARPAAYRGPVRVIAGAPVGRRPLNGLSRPTGDRPQAAGPRGPHDRTRPRPGRPPRRPVARRPDVPVARRPDLPVARRPDRPDARPVAAAAGGGVRRLPQARAALQRLHRPQLHRRPEPVRPLPRRRHRPELRRRPRPRRPAVGPVRPRRRRRAPPGRQPRRGPRVPRLPPRPELHQEHHGAQAGDAPQLLQVPRAAREGDRPPPRRHPHAQAGEAAAQVPRPRAGAEAARRPRRGRHPRPARQGDPGGPLLVGRPR